MRHERVLSGFSLLEVLISVVLMAMAIVPLTFNVYKQEEQVGQNQVWVKVMHTSGTILNRLLKEVPHDEIVSDYNLSTGAVEVYDADILENLIADIRALKIGTPEQEVFADLKFGAPEESGLAGIGQANPVYFNFRNENVADADTASASKIYYQMKIKRFDKQFHYYKNNITDPKNLPADVTEKLKDGSLMRITLTAAWQKRTTYTSTDGKVGAKLQPYYYSLVTMKANLSE
jgi:hypothetical protein